MKFKAPKSNLWPYYSLKIAKDLGANLSASGEGGDELFGGYYFRYINYLKHIPKTPFGKANRYLSIRTRDWIPNLHKMFGKRFKKGKKLIFTPSDLIKHFQNPFENNLSYLDQIFLADFNFKLRFDFNYVDTVFANTEKIKLESPFLQQNLIQFATHIPYKYKLSKNTSKMILRDVLKKIGAPPKIYKKPKQGWGMRPTTVWKRGLEEKCEKFLVDGNLVRDEWINPQWIKEAISFIENKMNHNQEAAYPWINKLWDILAFEIFYVQRILKESKNGVIANW